MKTFALCFLCSAVVVQSGRAGVALFARPTDTIRVDNNTVALGGAATYEARILFTDQYAGFGFVFNEHTFALEDKQLMIGPNANNVKGFSYAGFSHGLSTETPYEIAVSMSIASNVWHHIAYVYDGAQERLYLDGVLVRSRAASGSIRNNTGYAAIGSNYRENEGRKPGFVGYVDTLRISSIARYSGARFQPPSGDLTADGQTVLLYNFNESVGSMLATDEGPLGRTGRLGLPPGTLATAPTFTYDPIPQLKMAKSGGNWVLVWEGPFRLQAAQSMAGSFEDVANASSPHILPTASFQQQFFRLRQP